MESSDSPRERERENENGNGNGNGGCSSPGDPKLGDGGTIAVESEEMKKKKASTLPLEVGTRIMCVCRWKNYKYYPVTIVERRKMGMRPKDYDYYVHYTDSSRNVFEWVKLEQLDLDSVETVVKEKVEFK